MVIIRFNKQNDGPNILKSKNGCLSTQKQPFYYYKQKPGLQKPTALL